MLYFKKMLEGTRPKVASIWLQQVIMSEAPIFGTPPKTMISMTSGDKGPTESQTLPLGCDPYIEIFKGGLLIFQRQLYPPMNMFLQIP